MNWLTGSASTQAAALAEVSGVLFAGGTLVFALVLTLLMLALRGRQRRRVLPTAWWTVGGGIVFPVIVLSALMAYSLVRTEGLERPPADPLVVGVTGHPWWWEVRYRDPAGTQWVAVANELRLPVGRTVQIGLSSPDLIHSFWVPALGGKMDLVPGRVNRLVVTPQRPGVHRGVCAEYCGVQHARMALHVVVQAPDEFERWLAAQAAPAATPEGPLAERGRRSFVELCAGCHTVRGVAEGAALAPDLTHVASRLHLGAGTLPNGHEALARWIADVQALKPGARMPSYGHLDRATLDALAAYLAQLR
ncbi:cytochrome c oxidase subunit II [Hydrogenophaga pseudoflava]|uniref:cytochrome c oxidase subunit II n=1 Tax=Hydrogenophaga pseudoflava TaxID=47421 RepID=UPI0027E44FC8|nr:cytochrome c oxidase subunit II [Hydrogenophaga pseudoflava]MDQ7746759.1 cytochrome c oxidase subunit II [Hydrogenophaga pseudoflava]